MIEEHERWAGVESKKRIPEDAADTRATVAHGGLMAACSITTGDVKLVTTRSVDEERYGVLQLRDYCWSCDSPVRGGRLKTEPVYAIGGMPSLHGSAVRWFCVKWPPTRVRASANLGKVLYLPIRRVRILAVPW